MFAIDENDVGQQMCEIADNMENPDEPLLYRQLMAVKPASLTPNQWLVQAGVNRSFFTNLRSRGRARNDIVEKLIEAIGMTPAQFYAQSAPDASTESRAQEVRARNLPFRAEGELRDVPVVGSALGADLQFTEDGQTLFAEVTDLFLDDVQDYARRPAALAHRRDVYAVTVVGSSMSDRWDPGDPVYVDPKTTPRIGDDVVVYLRKPDGDDGERMHSVLIKRLQKRTASFIELLQLNPRMSFPVPMKDVAMIHRVIPYREMVLF
ncbi:S24 family peptidase [Sphingobium yanoikuyae]|jgi:phage repressor protein C with HTH and peptisase S24 domain|nr:S24 family peptidase [Sphingobium yanoikuyae]MDH2147861.1 hypothetical protein [Sphingobium yanoikuyae]